MAQLRSENGCNWDKKQTYETLREFIIEESYEVVDAVENKNFPHLREELGDLLFNIVFFARIAEEEKRFNFKDIAIEISEKLIRRHPHVFNVPANLTPDEVLANWNRIKEEEKKNNPKPVSILDPVPKSLPSILRAEKLQKLAAKVGFDWEKLEDVKSKLQEEIDELYAEIENPSMDQTKIEDEIGDVLFSVINLARFLKISPEVALNRANLKFTSRFQFIEKEAKAENKNLEDMTLEEMDKLWDKAKLNENI
ncbi:MAG TPA: nucleoside triphosphate pyrophosphohydrolase [Leptospiraceae bacterium]|nr:nucleoside triphosphate pyrophosphohydrolase [Leptospiraceae bacterium]HMW06377.1 nucleoside triphosphate pyrophosphohydrolase [Leptospiraceae bacterium]HMX31711.1 nucleoside triphosphate pyrophosphohydrolase [Leptospiraceae bacterium]HMY31997.1 nucleoside triphosphate pyrophosphohydrolase [Leptospiraceae bacterium]HMZ65790.1 nucleoside triphosphate pyrophosphohydrolase [Leptospiraceae bacterium]